MFKNTITIPLAISAVAVILLLQLFPHYLAFLITPKGFSFTGHAVWFDAWDINVYISAIRWAQEHGFSFVNAYTTLPHKPVILWPFYTVLGVLFPRSNPFIIYHASLILLTFCMLNVIWRTSKVFLKTNHTAAILLITLGGGFGWLLYPWFRIPDTSITPFTFTSTFQRPHEIFAVILYLVSLILFYRGVIKTKFSSIVVSSLLLLLLMLLYPYYLLSYYVICGGFALFFVISAKKFLRYPLFYFFFTVAATLPPGLIYGIYLLTSSGFENVLLPNLGSPNIILIALGYGILAPILLYQLLKVKKDNNRLFLNVWFFASLALSQVPVGFSRYYLRGLFFPAVLLCLLALPQIAKKLKITTGKLLVILIVLVPLSTLFITYKRIAAIASRSPWVYIANERKEALDFLNKNTPTDSGVILAFYPLANYVPAYTHNRVYFGHKYQTPNAAEKHDNIKRFYNGDFSEAEAKTFLSKNNISYVIFEQQQEIKYAFLKKVFDNKTITVYTY